MGDDVDRYSVCDREDDPYMERCEDGDWVNFADYTALAAERDALRAALDQIESHRRLCMQYDEENGHPPRTFDEEDLRIMEIAARTALNEIARAV